MSSGGMATALLVAVVLLVPATVGLFTIRSTPRRAGAGASGARAGLASTIVGLATLATSALIGSGPGEALLLALALAASVVLWARVAHSWAVRGLVAWALTIDAAVLYLAYVVRWTATADLTVPGTVASVLLVALEAFVLLIGAGFAWELVDVLARRGWSSDEHATAAPGARRPFVSLHVPTHNEPPDLVIATLEALQWLAYDDYEVIVVDNNTDDPALWEPVREWCAGRTKFTFLHLADWPGYKSGALNEALRHTDPRAEVIGIVDADYVVDSDFLAACAPLLADPDVVFVQTPQDYRDWDVAPYFRRLYRSYAYFFDVSQRSRAERNGAIFGGTMGLIRRSSLEAVGGWDEWCITEDAELSLRLLKTGGRGVHVDRSYGRGLMPLTFEALKRQRFRWCFGGIQILRLHLRALLPGRRTADNRLTPAQRWAYLVGGLQWFGDLASVLFTGFLVLGALDLLDGSGLVVRRMSGLLLTCVLVLVVLGALRSLALVRRTSGAGWRECLGAFGIWLALGWTVALGSFRGLFAREGVFLRTPKVRGELGWRDALRGNRAELVLGVVCAVLAVAVLVRGAGAAGVVVAVLLVLHAAGYLAAPLNSLAAIRSDLPEELRRRRREALLSWGTAGARRGGFVLVATGALLVVLVGLAAPVASPDLPVLGDRFGDQADGDDGDDEENEAEPAPEESSPADSSTTSGSAEGTPSTPASRTVDGTADAPTIAPAGPPSSVPATRAPLPTVTPAPPRPTPTTADARPTRPPRAPTDPGRPADPGGGRP
ncbi:MAG TPA: glycosyltransferase [Nocardioides sp.]|nr:glycosyltransferase [Nocardioides sp.]